MINYITKLRVLQRVITVVNILQALHTVSNNVEICEFVLHIK
jgi:hypothetical protein